MNKIQKFGPVSTFFWNGKNLETWLFLVCVWLPHQIGGFLVKTKRFYLSRSSLWIMSSTELPPKCFQPETSKLPCICLGKEKVQNKVSANEPKSMQNPLKHQHWPFQTTSQSTKVIRDPSRGFRPKKKKSKIWSFSSLRRHSQNQSGFFFHFLNMLVYHPRWIQG